jgi:tetratricopeptide (TPR) repeat protein
MIGIKEKNMSPKYICAYCFTIVAMVTAPVLATAQMGGNSTGAYSEDPGMGIDRGDTWRELMEGSHYVPLDEDTFTTIVRSRTYHLTKRDNRASGKAIAWEQIKESISDELIDNMTQEAKAAKNVSKKVYGKSAGISYELLPDRKDIKVILPSIIAFEETIEDWEEGTLRLGARTRVALARIVTTLSKIRANAQAYNEINSVRTMAREAMEEIRRIRSTMAGTGERGTSDQPYIEAVHRLIAADRLERGRYFALKGDTQQALGAYTQAIEAAPGLAIAYRNRGAIHAFLKQNRQAIVDFLRAYSNDAIEHMKSKEFDACISDTKAALSLHEEYGLAYYQRAVCHIGLGDQKMAKADFIKAAQLGERKAQDLLTSKDIAW